MGHDHTPPTDRPFELPVCERNTSDSDLRKFEGYMTEIFGAFGMDMNSSATKDTPRRFVRALYDSTCGYEGDPKLVTAFGTECHGTPDCELSQVIEGPIQFYSLCEHHAFPFHGEAYVGYVAHEHIIGISKLTRLVRLFARRFTLQERISYQIVETLTSILQPHGVAVYLRAYHLCTQMRGVQESSPLTHTTAWRGEYAKNANLRSEFLEVCRKNR